MNLLLAFAAFAVMEHVAGAVAGLSVAAIVSALLVARDGFTPGRRVKLLEIGSLLLFAGLAVLAVTGDVHWTRLEVRLRVDAGLFLIVLLSLVVRHPFTLAYTKAHAPESAWTTPRFRRLNDVLTAGWAVAFAALVAVVAAMLHMPDALRWIGIAATAAALLAALRFTRWVVGSSTAQQA